MRLTAEAPANLNISSAISVQITNQGFIGGTALAILPTAVTFVNPGINPGIATFTIFTAAGGVPPYQWDNSNDSLGEITPGGIPNINQQATYTLTGPIPTDASGVLTDTVILTDSRGTRVTATVTVIFADCDLQLSVSEITFTGAKGGESFDISILNGVPLFTTTHTVPAAGQLSGGGASEIVTYTTSTPPLDVEDTVLIRDSRGCTGTVDVTIEPATVETLTVTASPTSVVGANGGNVTITALAFDGNNQPFAGATLLFTITSGSGTLSPTTATTDATGRATATLTIPAGTAGDVTVTVTPPGGTPVPVTIDVT
jgi:hypothetical protein